MSMQNGVIVINKEKGFTSFDVVAKMRGILHEKKIGHTGTLDPDAVGVLPVCIGNATKIVDLLTEKDKEYITEFILGIETDTQDMTGKILTTNKVNVSEVQVIEAIESFVGKYMQIPPMYSALKVGGKKLYELAREGKEVERKAREVFIKRIEILDITLPKVQMKVCCSKGTYIRTLCADIGAKLMVGASMQSLKRTRVGDFLLEKAITLKELETLRDENRLDEVLIPVDEIFTNAPKLVVKEMFGKLLDNGNAFRTQQTVSQKEYKQGEWVRVYKYDGKFIGIYAFDETSDCYKPVKMFL